MTLATGIPSPDAFLPSGHLTAFSFMSSSWMRHRHISMPDKVIARSACGYEHFKSQAASMSYSLRMPGLLCRSGSSPGNSAARRGELWSHRMHMALGLTGLSRVQTSKNLGLLFSCQMKMRLRKPAWLWGLTRITQAKSWCLTNASLKKTWTISFLHIIRGVFCLFFK